MTESSVPRRSPTAGRRRLTGLLPVALVSLLACSSCAPRDEAPSPTMVPSPATSPSGEPNLCVGADNNVYLSWVERIGEESTLKFSRWEGEGWSEATVIASGKDWFVNWADFPAISALEDGTLAAHWLAKVGADTYAYGIYISLSTDGGNTWAPPVVPHRDGTPTEHGFVSLFPYSEDRFGVVWLDGRETGGGHGHGGGPMTLRYATVDRNGDVADDALLDPKVCDCCQTGAVSTGGGSVLVAYRDRHDDEVRDISAVQLTDEGWSEPRAVHEDGWVINGCPVNGPALDFGGGGWVVAAWFTVEEDDSARVRVAFSRDGGASFGPPIRVDDGDPHGRVDVAVFPGGSAVVTWLEQADSTRTEIRMRRVSPLGSTTPSLVVAETSPSRASGFPRMTVRNETVFFAWTDVEEPPGVRTAVYR